MSRMKSLSRSYLQWVKMNEGIKKRVKTCESCKKHQSIPALAPIHPWEQTYKPWLRLHIDYLGIFMGKMFVVIGNSYSKLVEVFTVSNSISQSTINRLRTFFATQGLPQICVSDKGLYSTSNEFELLMKKEQHFTYQICPASSGYKWKCRKTCQNF